MGIVKKMKEKKTTLLVSKEVWTEVKRLKDLGDTTDDVLRRLLNMPKEVQ